MKLKTFLILSFATLFSFSFAESEWVTLFDGTDLTNWVDKDGKPVSSEAWSIDEQGILVNHAKKKDLFSKQEYGDFELRWEWKISTKGNSGVKYKVTQFGKEWLGPEYQMLDNNDSEAGAKGSLHRTAALYEFKTSMLDPKPLGEWNQSKIVVKGNRFEHYLNGKLAMSIELGDQEWEESFRKSKFAKHPDFARNKKGKIMLQDHNTPVWFRNIEIRELQQ